MRLAQTPYFLIQALKNLRNNFWVHVIGVGTMTVSLVIFGTFLLLFVNVNAWVQSLGAPRTMSVFLNDGLAEKQLQSVRDAIEKIEGSRIVRFISKDDALADMSRILGSHRELVGRLGHNPLPASFEVVFEEKSALPDAATVSSMLETLEEVESVQITEEWVSRIEGFIAMVRAVGFVIGGLLGIGVLMIVTNTIKLTVHSRRAEVEILKLVGATDAFVKAPFFLEGVIHGMFAGAASLGVLFSGYVILSSKVERILGLAGFGFHFIPAWHAGALWAAAVGLGLLGSAIALGRFFRS